MHACLQFLREKMEKRKKGLNLYGDRIKHSTAESMEKEREREIATARARKRQILLFAKHLKESKNYLQERRTASKQRTPTLADDDRWP